MEVDTQKDIQFYSHLIDILGQEKADPVAEKIFAMDLSWIDWELCQSERPKAFYYKILESERGFQLVHQRDLVEKQDILTKINPRIRKGLEFAQMSNVRSKLLAAENGTTAVWISPKKVMAEDPEYPLDQINIAKKIDKETVWVKQLQGDFTLGALAKFVNSPSVRLEDLMQSIGEEGGVDFNFEEDSDLTKGRKYLLSLKEGLTADSLSVKRAELLDTMSFVYSGGGSSRQTSCGLIETGNFYAGELVKGPSWTAYDIDTGEFKCNFCWKKLPRAWLKLHNCVCKK